ncbi:MAG TPA: DUF1330 domain-containing protein [Thermoanaerobaculia bacterium]|jgi:uncharacterized protein (DUF1330 family)
MPAYIIVDVDVLDTAEFARYAELAPPTIAQYGGRYLARGGRTALLDGEPAPKRVVILEFPTFERAREWEASPEYAPARAIRQRAARVRMVVVEGIDASK